MVQHNHSINFGHPMNLFDFNFISFRKSPKVKVPESEANKEEMIRLSKAPLTLNGHAQV